MGLKLNRTKKKHFLLSFLYRINKLVPLNSKRKLKLLLDLEWIFYRLASEESAKIFPYENHPSYLYSKKFLLKKITKDYAVLEIGCASGGISNYIANISQPSIFLINVDGVDIPWTVSLTDPLLNIIENEVRKSSANDDLKISHHNIPVKTADLKLVYDNAPVVANAFEKLISDIAEKSTSIEFSLQELQEVISDQVIGIISEKTRTTVSELNILSPSEIISLREIKIDNIYDTETLILELDIPLERSDTSDISVISANEIASVSEIDVTEITEISTTEDIESTSSEDILLTKEKEFDSPEEVVNTSALESAVDEDLAETTETESF